MSQATVERDFTMKGCSLVFGLTAEVLGTVTVLLVVFGIMLVNNDMLASAGVTAFLTVWAMSAAMMSYSKYKNGQVL